MRRLIVIILMVLIAGCGNDQQRYDATTDTLTDILAARPEVVDAKITYQNSLDAAATAAANVEVTEGSDPKPIADEVVRLLWTSTLTPLNGVSVSVWDVTDNKRSDVRQLQFEDPATRQRLESEHGKRPV
ncbi:hypothetical protein FB565_004248 [Actinoplanes lutulentus]|uniref:Uncharacterized protein n=1 Tax=Actinoplanes lutulentus TaxID=1287878 RepID=A0A327ZHT2_9ACTN|nr:hypothetical protein [Actinoplanes lutulentus]MBB2944519.1 hypothetical protein [Actinoplanes lutulentus]RAK42249.1 hypothetical protein B0I29_10274 [Actinoplanes lutulentus]